jgi:hypothetical protein
MFTKRYKQFLGGLPIGKSEAHTPQGESIAVEKTPEGTVLLRMEKAPIGITAADYPRSFYYTFFSSDEDTYQLQDCWEETDEQRHYPVTHTSLYMAEQVIATFVSHNQEPVEAMMVSSSL